MRNIENKNSEVIRKIILIVHKIFFMELTATYTAKKTFKSKTILFAGLLVGLLDGTAAIINYLVKGGKHPEKIFNFIASGVFGKDGLSGGTTMMAWGILFHLLIAFTWALFFFLLYPKIKVMRKNWIITGIVYGLFIWIVMNRIVLPLSNTPSIPFKINAAIIAALILIIAIGLPLSFIAYKQYSKTSYK